ncbi:MAG: monovalent cation/H(+) antiporter subunit G [Rhodospirillaceae bacterium]|jgi:multicomponent Na+:H+ antiporter subunit G|nr:monovalent cation/H(+) antiporter subunit G [Rhodospirillaceae bacterium]MBT4590223.1 monovalent cation/H(+) antiporter subunit G [Rhodospirillaceae bacterium]MBT4941140.1 monovalent cation/H(+) antiporter subunit G [Rhodospirillaceae bacterium]MBT7268745.1 monovalent cation/H(+) antiporter subunit G [Rhodospirillaceae bacterium]
MIIDILSWILILLGGAFSIISAVGILRLPDVYTRMHAAGIGDTLALGALALGMMLQAGLTIVTVKLFLILLFMFFASPTTTHALAKAALAGGLKPQVDEDQRETPSPVEQDAAGKGENP